MSSIQSAVSDYCVQTLPCVELIMLESNPVSGKVNPAQIMFNIQ